MDNGLQELVRRYFRGEVNYAEYRYARGRLIDAIAGTDVSDTASGVTAPHVRVPRAGASPPLPERRRSQPDVQTQPQPRQQRVPPVVTPPAVPEKAGGGQRYWLVLAAVLGLSGVVAAVMMFGHRAPPPVQATARPDAVQGTAGQNLLAAFLRANDWSAGAIATFSHDWDALAPEARQAAHKTPEFQRLADALYQRIAEQRALDDAATAAPSEGKQIITAFAEYLGIDYASLQAGAAPVAPPAIIAAPPAPAAQAATDKPVEQAAETDSTPIPAPAPAPAAEPTPAPVAESVAPPTIPPTAAVNEPKQSPADAIATPAAAPATIVAAKPKPAVTGNAASGTAGSAGACRIALLGTRRPLCNDQVAPGLDGPLLALIPGGEFQMGGTRNAEEQPPHPVRIARAFAMGVHETSVAEFLRFCRATQSTCPPVRWPADDYPVVDVSWNDAEAYVRWLSQVTGQRYRLPSEAEWEYAARAGSTTAYPAGDELLITDARFAAQGQETTPLPISDHSINRNRFRLAHMVGNVREWVRDAWQSNYQGALTDGGARPGGAGERVVRGGSYADSADQLRSSARAHLPAESRDAVTGFRVVREVAE